MVNDAVKQPKPLNVITDASCRVCQGTGWILSEMKACRECLSKSVYG